MHRVYPLSRCPILSVLSARSPTPTFLTEVAEVFEKNWETLMDNFDADKFAVPLFKKEISSSRDMNEVLAPWKERERRVLLLMKLSSRIIPSNIETFFQVLEETKQSKAHEILRKECEELRKIESLSGS